MQFSGEFIRDSFKVLPFRIGHKMPKIWAWM